MNFWISGEVMADVSDAFREARNEVEDELNEYFASHDYGQTLKKLAFIAIVRPAGDEFYPEIYKYNKKDKLVEARLKVAHSDLQKASNKADRKRLLLDAVERAIARLGELKIDADHERLLSDFQEFRAIA
jgi:hypothetical protein